MSGPNVRRLKMAVLGALFATVAQGRADDAPVRSQLLYVPVYSEVPVGDSKRTLNLTAVLSVRNTDGRNPVTVRRVDYFSDAGTLIRSYLKAPEALKPLASARYVVRETDRTGGVSASFLVEWESAVPVSAPYVEAIMVHHSLNQGVAFSSPARVLEQRR
jgi:hypothetical protein